MSLDLPASFGPRVNSLVHCLDRYESAVSASEKEGLQREALSICCNLLGSLDLDQLQDRLQGILATLPRDQAAKILEDTRLYDLFEVMEDELLHRAGIGFAARDRILAVLRSVRYEAAHEAAKLDAKEIVASTAELKMWICKAKDDKLSSAGSAQDESAVNERDTRLVNSLGTVTWVVNSAAAVAVAASLLFLPVMSGAAVGASLIVGKVAESRKPRKVDPEAPRATPTGPRVEPPPKGMRLKVWDRKRP
jgi:hypothetical protein